MELKLEGKMKKGKWKGRRYSLLDIPYLQQPALRLEGTMHELRVFRFPDKYCMEKALVFFKGSAHL